MTIEEAKEIISCFEFFKQYKELITWFGVALGLLVVGMFFLVFVHFWYFHYGIDIRGKSDNEKN